MVRIGFTASEAMFENVDGRRTPGDTITSPTDKKYKWANSKFNTSLACKSIYTFFVATENTNCTKIVDTFSSKFPRTPMKNVNNSYIFRQQYRRKMNNLRKSTFIHFSRFIHCSFYQGPRNYFVISNPLKVFLLSPNKGRWGLGVGLTLNSAFFPDQTTNVWVFSLYGAMTFLSFCQIYLLNCEIIYLFYDLWLSECVT